MPYFLLVTAFVVNGLASVFLKLNAVHGAGFKDGASLATITGNKYLVFALFLFATNIIFYYLALRTIPLSLAYPVMVTGTFFIVSLSSLFIFQEHLTGMQIFGYLLVIAGITLVSIFS